MKKIEICKQSERNTNTQINNNQEAITKALTNQIRLASLSNSLMMNISNQGPFKVPNKNIEFIYLPYESYQTNLDNKIS